MPASLSHTEEQSHNSKHSAIGNGEWLLAGQSLWSTDGRVELRMQTDGKLAVYRDGNFLWQNTKDQNYDVKGLTVQQDGNCCI